MPTEVERISGWFAVRRSLMCTPVSDVSVPSWVSHVVVDVAALIAENTVSASPTGIVPVWVYVPCMMFDQLRVPVRQVIFTITQLGITTGPLTGSRAIFFSANLSRDFTEFGRIHLGAQFPAIPRDYKAQSYSPTSELLYRLTIDYSGQRFAVLWPPGRERQRVPQAGGPAFWCAVRHPEHDLVCRTLAVPATPTRVHSRVNWNSCSSCRSTKRDLPSSLGVRRRSLSCRMWFDVESVTAVAFAGKSCGVAVYAYGLAPVRGAIGESTRCAARVAVSCCGQCTASMT